MNVDAMLAQHRDGPTSRHVNVSKNVIEKLISVKHLTPPPFTITILWGEESGVTTVAEEVTTAGNPVYQPHLAESAKLRYQLDIDGQTLADCGLLCAGDSGTGTDVFLNGEEHSIACYLVGIKAIASMLSSLFTVLTFIIDPSRSIVFLSTCYLSVRLAYVVGFAIRPRITCVSPFVGGEETEQPENGGMKVVTRGAKK